MIRALTNCPRFLDLPLLRRRSVRFAAAGLFVLVALSFSTILDPFARTSASGDRVTKPKQSSQLAQLSDYVSIRAANRSSSGIHLGNGRDVLTAYEGPQELRQLLEQNQAQPLSVAAADFDEDGVPDLISGYGYEDRGLVTVLRGNVDAIYPNTPEAQQRKSKGTFTSAPFLSPARVFAVDRRGDFIGAGDFDGDSHWDIVVASRVTRSLHLLPGDGHGGFAPAREIVLPGVVTALTTGEINRRDGLTDVVVGITNETQSQVLVFEGPNGALRAAPETFNMPAEVGAVALGQLDGRYPIDLAVAAGNQLVVLAGRDRKLSLDAYQQATVSAVLPNQRTFATKIRSMALGDFAGGGLTDVALLTDDDEVHLLGQGEASSKRGTVGTIETWAEVSSSLRVGYSATLLIGSHTSGSTHDDLFVIDAANSRLDVLTSGDPGGALTAETTDGKLAPLQFAASLDVSNPPVAVLSMRLNADALSDLVVLQAKQTAPSFTPTATAATFIVNSNADTNDGVCNAANCTLREAINAANANAGADTINFSIGNGVQTIIPLTPLPTVTDSVTIDGTTQPGFGSTPIIELSGSGVSNGTFALLITGGNTTVRGLVINRFDGNPGPAIRFQTNGGNIVEGNFIGTDVTGTLAFGNGKGVFIDGPSNNRIGGTTAAARNLISGNGRGIETAAPTGFTTTGNLVQGNFIGTDVAGTADLGNSGNGVQLFRAAAATTIGGTVAGAGNIISGNDNSGIGFDATSGVLVQGNFIGTDLTGAVDLGNSQMGVQLPAGNPSNTVGGTTAAARNVVSGNNIFGFQIRSAGTENNLVQGNFIGTNSLGTAAIPNTLDGVSIESSNNTIGGAAEAGNIISGNGRDGISIFTNSGITVRNNFIGTAANGTTCLGNGRDGIFVNNGSVGHTIAENLITCNGRNGVNIPSVITNDPGVRIFLDNNRIFANGALGIDLGDPGITPNDFQDPDGGANLQQNFPILTSVVSAAQFEAESSSGSTSGQNARPISTEAAVIVNGSLNSTPSTTFTVHWYFSGDSQCLINQQSSRPLVSGKLPNVSTNANGDAQFLFPLDLPTGINNGIVNCTATDPQGNTSEFSACLPVSASPSTTSVQFSASSYNKSESGPSTNITVTRTGNISGASSVNFGTGNNSYVACNQINQTAVQNCDFILSSGTLNFAAGETSKTFPIIILEDWYQEGNETVSLTLSSPTGAVLGNLSTATLTIADNDVSAPTGNPLDDPAFYVRQHYYDFLGRLPDDGGLAFWTSEITACGANQACINERRVAVSNAFFFEAEYQQTASYVFLLYRASYGNDQPFPNPDPANAAEAKKLPRYLTFVRDRAQVVGGSNLAQTQLALANAFVQRTEFTTKYSPTTLATGSDFVNAVLATIQTSSGVDLSSQSATLISHFNTGGRGLVMFHLANDYWNGCDRLPGSPAPPCVPAGFGAAVDNRPFIEAEYNRSFVYSQYSGYLRRDSDIGGFLFWLTEVSKSPPRNVPRQRAMVCSFVTSTEYQQRLSPIATHNNSECPPPP
ncbi:MAG: CSLREA domain-containing protein [Pyrinomonadaceae bacterium]